MKYLYLFLYLIAVHLLTSSISLSAEENWLCTSESSLIQGSDIHACGVGDAKDEDSARALAFNSAKREFDRICSVTTACVGKAVSVEPKRTTCETEGGKWKCYRLLVFTVSEKSAKVVIAQTQAKEERANREYTNSDFWRDWRQKYLKPRD